MREKLTHIFIYFQKVLFALEMLHDLVAEINHINIRFCLAKSFFFILGTLIIFKSFTAGMHILKFATTMHQTVGKIKN